MTKKNSLPIYKYELKNGEIRYKFQVYLYTDALTGKEKRTTRGRFKTRKQAELALARIKLDVANGTYKQESVETYQQIYDIWIKQYEKTVEESTFVKTSSTFKHHILPAMGNYKIEKINVDVCQKYVNAWEEELQNFRKVKAYASRIFDFSIKRGYIQQNPFDYVDMPNRRSKKILGLDGEVKAKYYTRDQLIEFLSYLEKEGNYKAYVLFRVLAFSGMRKGEALALTWSDLNFKTNELSISKAISHGKDNTLYLKDTKTREVRNIKLDGKTMTILKEWKKRQKQDYLVLGYNTLQSNQLIFSNERNEFLQPSKTNKWIKSIQKKYNLVEITTHGLRHTHCSLLFSAGVSLKEVQDRLGHSDVQTTLNIYTHVTKEAKEGAITKFADFMGS